MFPENYEPDGRKRRSAKTRSLIIKAATEVFLEKGYKDTTFKEISSKAGVGYGTIYLYFKNKEDLLAEIVNDIMGRIRSKIYIQYAPGQVKDVKEIVYSQVYGILTLVEENKAPLKILWNALAHSEKLRNHWNNIFDQFVQRVIEDISYSRQQGLARSLNERIVAKAIVYMVKEFFWDVILEKETDIMDLSFNLTELYTEGAYKNTVID